MAFISLPALAACAPAPTAEDLVPDYLGAGVVALAEDLRHVTVAMSTVLSARDLQDYADCAVSAQALGDGMAYARHVHTKTYKEAGVFAADAVYTVSPTRPEGLSTIDASAQVAECRASGIPTV